MVFRVVKVIAVVFSLVAVFFLYEYYFGHGYGGKYYQRKSFDAEAEYILRKYHEEQTDYFRLHQKYRNDLLEREPYNTSKRFKVGFAAEVPEIARYCPECALTATSFRIGAYGVYDGRDVVWVIDNEGKLANLIGAAE